MVQKCVRDYYYIVTLLKFIGIFNRKFDSLMMKVLMIV